MNPLSPAVITSKTAQKEIDTIRSNHTELVAGLATHTTRLATMQQQNQQQKATEMQSKQTMDHEIKKQQMVSDSAAQKNAMDFSIKQSEIDIKRAALAATD